MMPGANRVMIDVIASTIKESRPLNVVRAIRSNTKQATYNSKYFPAVLKRRSDKINIKGTDIAKRVEKIITSDLRQHHPAWELAAQFSISETSLKNYFRGVFGQNISIYLREVRMKKAAELLATTRLSVAEVAEQVGYMNQSKFASVFKKQFGLSPLEYRRSKNLENG